MEAVLNVSPNLTALYSPCRRLGAVLVYRLYPHISISCTYPCQYVMFWFLQQFHLSQFSCILCYRVIQNNFFNFFQSCPIFTSLRRPITMTSVRVRGGEVWVVW
ncbi:hypothetical protein EB796_008141 [Bugula neritina]|uniref:Uncharacterized protein n=1 Tax=Bugula neritina TaxID=10212 RepID=A0A7J7K7E7_BUGNE|nr:hypothetical protein EB796_008141 [Bugula neritina]